MELKCRLEKRVSKKSGKEYVCIVIEFPNGYRKIVFPESSAESYMIQQLIK